MKILGVPNYYIATFSRQMYNKIKYGHKGGTLYEIRYALSCKRRIARQ